MVDVNQRLSDREEQIAARHKGDPVFEWFQKSSNALWNCIKPVQNFFRAQLSRSDRINNSLLSIGFLLTIFIGGLLTVGFLSLIVAPIIQIILTIVAMIAVLVRVFLRMIRVLR